VSRRTITRANDKEPMKKSIICIALLICLLISCSPLSDKSKEPLPSAVFDIKNGQIELHVSGESGYVLKREDIYSIRTMSTSIE
jgi:hypothetical protein